MRTVREKLLVTRKPSRIEWGIPCQVCGWRSWRQLYERFHVVDRQGRPVRRLDGTLTRERPVLSMRMLHAGGWACRHCVERLKLRVSEFDCDAMDARGAW